jgi:rare lipoprotein A
MKMIALLLLLALMLSGCISGRNPGGYFEDDGPQRGVTVDVSRIPNAVPKWEPIDPRNERPYTVMGHTYYPMKSARGYRQIGIASWYGRKFHGQRTSLGERYDMYAMTAAHKTLPLPSYVRVTDLDNGRWVIVRVNDRGPFLHNRLIDLSYAAAKKLGIVGHGTGRVEVTAITPGQQEGPTDDDGVRTRSLQANAGPVQAQPLPAEPQGGRLYLQVGAFSLRERAEKLRTRLRKAGLGPVLVQTAVDGARTFFRVRIGPLDQLDRNGNLAERVSNLGIPHSRWVTE